MKQCRIRPLLPVFLAAFLVVLLAGCAAETAEKTTITDIRQLDGQTIGVLTGSTFDQYTDTYISDATKEYYTAYADMALAVEQGRIAAFLMDEPMARVLCAENPAVTYLADYLTEDGYAFEYSFGTIYADSPAMSIDTQLLSIVLTSAEEQGPRDIQVGDELSIVLEANYSENPSLRGSRESAVLYVLDLLPESMRWGEVKRDGQRVQTVEYAVHERVETDGEGYTDTGVIFTMEDNIVSAIRVYGLSARTTEAEISTVRDNLRFDALFDDYVQVPSSYNGADLPMFDGTDLQFSGIDFMSLAPESAADVLGDVIDDVWVENGTDGYVRTMTFAACDITFLYDAQKQNPQVEMLLIAADGMEGPRASRIGDTFAQVYNRFRNDNTAIDENDTEHLYGDEESGQYGVVEYTVDGTVMRFGLVLDDGVRVVLRLEFTASVLSEIMVYIE